MISVLRGNVFAQEADGVIVDVGGVGFHVLVPAGMRDRLQPGETVFLYTRMIVREESISLCGFENRESREMFDSLLSVSGIGTRLAMTILSTLSLDMIRAAVVGEQSELFSRVPGIGKKTAQKIILYLHDRMPVGEGLGTLTMISDIDTEVMAALTSLGYSLVEAQAALQYIPRDTPQEVETRLRVALQYFST